MYTRFSYRFRTCTARFWSENAVGLPQNSLKITANRTCPTAKLVHFPTYPIQFFVFLLSYFLNFVSRIPYVVAILYCVCLNIALAAMIFPTIHKLCHTIPSCKPYFSMGVVLPCALFLIGFSTSHLHILEETPHPTSSCSNKSHVHTTTPSQLLYNTAC